MKLVGSRSSKDKNRSSVKKTRKGRVDLSEDPQRHVQQKMPPDAPAGGVQQPVSPAVPNGAVQETVLNGVTENPVQQTLPNDVAENPVQQTLPNDVTENPVQQPVSIVEPQTFSYPRTELTSAQQAALQNVFDIYGEDYSYETGLYRFTRGLTVLEFLVEDDIVMGITYRLLLDL